MEDIKVSVIVPIYNVERFIVRCVESLLSQTLKEVELIFVDDATPDRSIELLQETIDGFPERKGWIQILRHPENKGLPAARNTGLAAASGQYVFHCDSDDFVEPDMLEALYATANGQNADIVWCDWYLSFEKNERYMLQPSFFSAIDAIKAMLSGRMKFNVWNKFVKRSLYVDHGIEFPSGYGMGEDMTMIMLFAYAKKIVYVPKAFYHYVKTNSTAFSQTYSARHLIELKYNVSRIEQFIHHLYQQKLDKEITFLKLDVKFPFLLSNDSAKYLLWKEWYPEANAFIMKNKQISFRSRLLQWCACRNQFWAVRLYAFLLNRVIYGLIFR